MRTSLLRVVCLNLTAFVCLFMAFQNVTRNQRRIALVHELVPVEDQGGNVRVHRVVEVMLRHGYAVDVFARNGGGGDQYLHFGNHKAMVFEDNVKLSLFRTVFKKYSMIFTTLWFWRTSQDSTVRSIPALVRMFFQETDMYIPHIVITDDLHHIRCAVTSKVLGSDCHQIFREELSIWEDVRMLKMFVADEDRKMALRTSDMLESSAVFIPFLLKPTATKSHTSRAKACSFSYFGNAHPANVLALRTMVERAADTLVEFDISSSHRSCELVVFGDDRWAGYIRSWDMTAMSDLRIEVVTKAYVPDLKRQLKSSSLILLPIVIGDTGVSSKVLTSIEQGIPFVSTIHGMRGFPCDSECQDMFFLNTIPDMLTAALARSADRTFMRTASRKMQEIHKAMMISSRNFALTTLPNVFKFGQFDTSSLSPYLLRGEHGANSFSVELKEKCSRCSSSSNCVSVCEIAPVEPLYSRTTLSVFMSINESPSEHLFIEGYLKDVYQQDFHLPWELIVSSSSPANLLDFRRIAMSLPRTNHLLTIKTVLMRQDLGLYESWDLIIQNHARADVLTNWNIDDRKHFSALRAKFSMLSSMPRVSLISSAVKVSHVPNQPWEDIETEGKWFDRFHGRYGLYALFQQDGQETSRLTSYNLPHSSPMYRRALHEKYGYFSSKWQRKPLRLDMAPSCSDFRFWTVPLSAGEVYFHSDIPMESNYIRLDSRNRASGVGEGIECVDQTVYSAIHTNRRALPNPPIGPPANYKVLYMVDAGKLKKERKLLRTLQSSMTSLLYAGYRPQVFFDDSVKPGELDLPAGVSINRLDRATGMHTFCSGVILTEHISLSRLRSDGIFVPHGSIFHVKDAASLKVFARQVISLSCNFLTNA